MTRNSLTGSQAEREIEIQNYSLVFEPIASKNLEDQNLIFSVPVGQTFKPELIISSGSYPSISGAILVEKEIHLFSSEQSANEFLNDIGYKNVTSIKEIISKTDPSKKSYEIHIITHPILEFNFEIEDLEERNGYKVEIFRSGSFGLEPVYKKILRDDRGRLLNDSYLKYFNFLSDI